MHWNIDQIAYTFYNECQFSGGSIFNYVNEYQDEKIELTEILQYFKWSYIEQYSVNQYCITVNKDIRSVGGILHKCLYFCSSTSA